MGYRRVRELETRHKGKKRGNASARRTVRAKPSGWPSLLFLTLDPRDFGARSTIRTGVLSSFDFMPFREAPGKVPSIRHQACEINSSRSYKHLTSRTFTLTFHLFFLHRQPVHAAVHGRPGPAGARHAYDQAAVVRRPPGVAYHSTISRDGREAAPWNNLFAPQGAQHLPTPAHCLDGGMGRENNISEADYE